MYTVNDAIRQLSVSDLSSCKGVGVVTAMLVKRCGAKRPYVSFDDMIARVTGLGKKNSVELITRLKAYVKAKNAKTEAEAKPQPAPLTYGGRCYGVIAKKDGKRYLVCAYGNTYPGPGMAHKLACNRVQQGMKNRPDAVWSVQPISNSLFQKAAAVGKPILVTKRA